MPADQGTAAADRRPVAARDQARRLSPRRAQGRRPRATLQPPRQRPDLPVLADRRGAVPAALALLHYRRLGGVLRRAGLGPVPLLRLRRNEASFSFDSAEFLIGWRW